jgi:3-methyladenine DNA glycosylase AlkD/8-oxo-dGTP pyrophosphatase MutT (NUDIX family)
MKRNANQMDARNIISELKSKAAGGEFAAFTKTILGCAPGRYGEGDDIIGVRMPDIREIAARRRHMPLCDIERLLHSKTHEARMLGLIILTMRYGDAAVDMYLANTVHVNNWDLVDASAPKLIGRRCFESGDYSTLCRLADSLNLWEQRIAMVATLHSTGRGVLEPALNLAQKFLAHPHDLMHKAAGWMLREVGKKKPAALLSFLDAHAGEMPRTMLRYAIERLDAETRRKYLAKKSDAKIGAKKRRSARAILISRRGRLVLLERRKKGRHYFVTPGGKIERGETTRQALARELMEETGSNCPGAREMFSFEDKKNHGTFFLCYEASRVKPNGPEWQKHDPNDTYKIVEIAPMDFDKTNLVPKAATDMVFKAARRAIARLATH